MKATYSEKDGIKAIIALQGFADIKESQAKAKVGWRSMSEREKQITIDTYRMIYGKEGAK